METWYEADPHIWATVRVLAVDVEKSTDKTVTINGRRNARLSEYRAYFPTAKEAWDWIEKRAADQVEHAKVTLQRYRSELGKIQSERAAAGI